MVLHMTLPHIAAHGLKAWQPLYKKHYDCVPNESGIKQIQILDLEIGFCNIFFTYFLIILIMLTSLTPELQGILRMAIIKMFLKSWCLISRNGAPAGEQFTGLICLCACIFSIGHKLTENSFRSTANPAGVYSI